jgi:hypothetical protein
MQPTCNHPFQPGLIATINTNKILPFLLHFQSLTAAVPPPAFAPVIHAIALGQVARETAI